MPEDRTLFDEDRDEIEDPDARPEAMPGPLQESLRQQFLHGTSLGGEESTEWHATLPIPGNEFVNLPHRQEPPLLGALLRRGIRVLIGGASGAGKSTVAGYMVDAALAAKDFCGFNGGPTGLTATLLDLEMSPAQVSTLLQRCKLEAHGDRFRVISDPGGLNLVPGDTLIARKQTEWLQQIMDDCDILTIDPYYKLFRETGTPMDRVLTEELLMLLDSMAKETDTCLIIPAHARKMDGKYLMRADDIYGPSILQRNASVILGIQILAFGKSRFYFFKDRFGELPVMDHWMLDFNKLHGFNVEGRSTKEITERDGLVAKCMMEAGRPLKMHEMAERTSLTNAAVAKSLDKLRMSPNFLITESRLGQHRFYELHERGPSLQPPQ